MTKGTKKPIILKYFEVETVLPDWDQAVSLMDDSLRRFVDSALSCTMWGAVVSDQRFFDTYCKYHQKQFGQNFEKLCMLVSLGIDESTARKVV